MNDQETKLVKQLTAELAACTATLQAMNDAAEKPAAPAPKPEVRVPWDAKLWYPPVDGATYLSVVECVYPDGRNLRLREFGGAWDNAYPKWDNSKFAEQMWRALPDADAERIHGVKIIREAKPLPRWFRHINGGRELRTIRDGVEYYRGGDSPEIKSNCTPMSILSDLNWKEITEAEALAMFTPKLRTPQVGDLLRVECESCLGFPINGESEVVKINSDKTHPVGVKYDGSTKYIRLSDAQNVIRPAGWKPKAGDKVTTTTTVDLFDRALAECSWVFNRLSNDGSLANIGTDGRIIVPTSTLRPVVAK